MRVRAGVGNQMMASDGHGQHLVPCEDLVMFGALCDVLEHFYCCNNPSKLQALTCSRGRRERVRAQVGDLMMDSDGHGQYLGQYLAPSEDLVTFGALCDILENF